MKKLFVLLFVGLSLNGFAITAFAIPQDDLHPETPEVEGGNPSDPPGGDRGDNMEWTFGSGNGDSGGSSDDSSDGSSDLTFEEKIQILLPSQESLFGNSKKLDKDGDGFIDEEEKLKLPDGDLEQGLAPRLLKILIQFSTLAFFVIFTYGGIRLIFARGDEEGLTKAKNLLLQTLIGAVIIGGSFGLIIGIIKFFDSL